ncbi:TorF family putative porin [Glaciimonas sp. PAMC28666]|uniref:TorF family putative porin n=1 Tax=Glaciimonas sp. PAMC28666 TaxID=2807626 RepID=UPI001F0481B7|nr:TorF family putative porin [Glaciimonas sp. PAMC28666]
MSIHPMTRMRTRTRQIGYGPAYLKYFQAVTNLFGFANSKNSGYVDLGANIDVTNG